MSVSQLSQLLSELRPELLRFLTARLGDPIDAEDELQGLWIQVAATGPVSNGRSYLYRCAQNLCRDRAPAHRRRARREGEWVDGQGMSGSGGIDPADPKPSVEQEFIEREDAERLAAAIAVLPEAAGQAFRLHKLDGMSHANVALVLGISVSGVEKHMTGAMTHLRRTLADCGSGDQRRLAGQGREKGQGNSGTAGTTWEKTFSSKQRNGRRSSIGTT